MVAGFFRTTDIERNGAADCLCSSEQLFHIGRIEHVEPDMGTCQPGNHTHLELEYTVMEITDHMLENLIKAKNLRVDHAGRQKTIRVFLPDLMIILILQAVGWALQQNSLLYAVFVHDFFQHFFCSDICVA